MVGIPDETLEIAPTQHSRDNNTSTRPLPPQYNNTLFYQEESERNSNMVIITWVLIT